MHRYAYFHNFSQEDLPYIKIPLHTLIKLTPKAYGCDEERYVFSVVLPTRDVDHANLQLYSAHRCS
jgi:hypothetical protein